MDHTSTAQLKELIQHLAQRLDRLTTKIQRIEATLATLRQQIQLKGYPR